MDVLQGLAEACSVSRHGSCRAGSVSRHSSCLDRHFRWSWHALVQSMAASLVRERQSYLCWAFQPDCSSEQPNLPLSSKRNRTVVQKPPPFARARSGEARLCLQASHQLGCSQGHRSQQVTVLWVGASPLMIPPLPLTSPTGENPPRGHPGSNQLLFTDSLQGLSRPASELRFRRTLFCSS